MVTATQSCALPSAVETKLRQIRRRQMILTAVRAVAIGASALILAMLAAMILDWWFTLFNPRLRTALTTISLLAAAAALLASGIPGLVAAWRFSRAAASADREVPQLEERWTTVTLIARANHRPATPLARAMLQQVTSEAVALQKLVEPGRVARPAALRPAGLLLGGCCVALAAFLALNWPQTSVLLRRFWSPQTEITATQLASLTGNRTIPRGESLDLVTQLSGVPRRTARLELAAGEEIVDVFTLRTDQERPDTFVHRLKVDQSFRYRVWSGDGRTPWHHVTAIDYPALGEVHLTITPPDYVDRPTYEKTLIPNRVRVVQGSRLVLRMKPQEPLVRMELMLTFEPTGKDEKPHERLLVLQPDERGWYQYETQLLLDMSLRPTLLNEHGLTNEDPHVCRIQVVPDKAPVARITGPSDEMVVAPDNVLEIKFEAHDDHGIASAELMVFDETNTGEGKEPKLLAVQPIPLGDQQLKQHVLASTQLDLNKLGLKEGANISYAIRVTDNRDVHLDPDALRAQMAEATPDENDPAMSSDREVVDHVPMENMLADSRNARNELKDEAAAKSQDRDRPTHRSAAQDDDKPNPEMPPGPSQDSPSKPTSQDPENLGDPKRSTAQEPSTDAKQESPSTSNGGTPQEDSQPGDRPTAVAASEKQAPQQSPEEQQATNPSAPAEISDRRLAMAAQRSESGQNAESARRMLKIAQRLAAVAEASDRRSESLPIRERVVEIDKLLAVAESAAQKLVQREVPDAQRSDLFQRLDEKLGEIEDEISGLRNETKDHQFAFVGLQMVDIGRSHVTPARERAFIGIREPLGSDNATVALQQIVRARERLAALLKRYDRVARDRRLAKGLEEAVKIYEVYVEKTHRLMREARQNINPLKRKMAIIEVDQEYLDRYAEVLTLRREMMAELARLLADDPRLLARYLDLTRRRRSSLRDQLTELADRQDDLTNEVLGWLEVGQSQQDVLWQVVAELRLQAATPLARDAAEVAEGIEKQLPLVLENDRGTSSLVIDHARQIAALARQASFDAQQFQPQASKADQSRQLVERAEQLVFLCGELEAALDQLNFQREDEEEVASYCASRLLELRALTDQAEDWAQMAGHLRDKRYAGLAHIDQKKLAIATELLRVEMLDLEQDLSAQFQQQAQASVPAEILQLVTELQGVMEAITFNQAAATYTLSQGQVEAAAAPQARAMEQFERAEKLFDKIRRAVAAALDEYDPPDPNIADLRDPTLDEFLARLEREPNLQAQLGIPNRPRNLRVLADTLTWQEQGGDMLGQSSDAAASRAQQMMRERQAKAKPPQKPDPELTEEERAQREQQRQRQETLEKSLAEIQKKADDPMTPPEQRRQLQQMAETLQRMLAQTGQQADAAAEWERIVESDKARGILKALAHGERLPDEQWNKLLSTLDDGLWQVRGRAPPEDYRKAIEQYQEYLRQLENGE